MQTDELRVQLSISRAVFGRLLDDAIVYTGQDGQNDGLAPGKFCRYCSEELPFLVEDEDTLHHHADNCEVHSFISRIDAIDAVLGDRY